MPESWLHSMTGSRERNPNELPSFSYGGPDTRAHMVERDAETGR